MFATIETEDGKEVAIVRITISVRDPSKPKYDLYNRKVSDESVRMLDAMCNGLKEATGKPHRWVWYI